MAPSVSAYAVIHATTRALYADLLSSDDWESLIEAADYDAVLELLASSPYGQYLRIDGGEPLSSRRLTPRRTVYQIRHHLIDVYTKLIRLAPKPAKDVLARLWRHYEVDNVKAALRGNEAGASWHQVLHLLYPMDRHIDVDTARLQEIVEAPDIERAIESLRGTPYYDVLSYALVRYRQERTLFPLEVALDLGYRRSLWEAINRLSGLDHEMALRTVGNILDGDNLLWAIRYRVYHNLSEQEIINYTLAFGYLVKDRDIRAIARGSDIADVVYRIYPEFRHQLEGVDLSSGEGLLRLERALLERSLAECRRVFLATPFQIGIPLGYVWLSEYEIRDLTVIIEAKATGTPVGEFVPMLVMAPEDLRLEQQVASS